MIINEKIKSIQGYRMILFLTVFFFHAHFFIEDTWINKRLFSGVGVQAVSYFFVLSGFVAAFSGKKILFSGHDEYFAYVKRRYIVFLKYHILFLTADAVICRMRVLLNDIWTALINFVLCFFLLQSWIPDVDVCLSYNGVAWFLSTSLFLTCVTPLLEKLYVMFISSKTYENRTHLFFIIGCCSAAVIVSVMCEGNCTFWLYFFPPTRLLDYIAGFAGGKLFLKRQEKKNKGEKYFVDFIFSVLICVSYIALLIINIELPEKIRRFCIYIPFAVISTYYVALNRGPLGKLVSGPLLVQLGNHTLYYMLSHQLILHCFYRVFIRLPFQNIYIGVVFMLLSLFLTIVSKSFVDKGYQIINKYLHDRKSKRQF